MYLLDTNVISEIRKGDKGNRGVKAFVQHLVTSQSPAFLAAVTIGELRRGVAVLEHRGDAAQARVLAVWLEDVLKLFGKSVIVFDEPCAQVWGRLMVPHTSSPVDKQIAATAIVHQLTLVTRNIRDFHSTGACLRNPFTEDN